MKNVPKLIRYRNGAFIAYLNDVLTVCAQFDAKVLQFNTELTALGNSVTELRKLFGVPRGNENTELLEALDTRRDNAIIGIETVCQGYLKHYETSTVEAAKSIIANIEIYGKNIDRLNYMMETEYISSLVADFEAKGKVNNALVKLNLLAWVAELKSANTAFNTLFLTRNKAVSELPDEKLRLLKQPIIDQYRTFIKQVDALYIVNKTPEYAKILREIDTLSLKYNSTLNNAPPKPDEPEKTKE